MNRVPVDLLRACVELDESTGFLYWKTRPIWTFNPGKYTLEREANRWNKRYSGQRAFNTPSFYGYLVGRLNETSLYSHRVVWALHHGNFPDLWLDHIDGNKTNNQIENLRQVAYKDNNKNSRLRQDNKTGLTGVSKRFGLFEANIKNIEGKQVFLGRFDNLEDAKVIRRLAELKYNYHPNHGRTND